jgi:hypothetical protein
MSRSPTRRRRSTCRASTVGTVPYVARRERIHPIEAAPAKVTTAKARTARGSASIETPRSTPRGVVEIVLRGIHDMRRR